jgi:hypothetical protein
LLVQLLSDTISYLSSKTIAMKKLPDFVMPDIVPPKGSNKHSEKIFEDLEIAQRTQRPPSEELITRLNELASKPPFCYSRKVKKNYPL